MSIARERKALLLPRNQSAFQLCHIVKAQRAESGGCLRRTFAGTADTHQWSVPVELIGACLQLVQGQKVRTANTAPGKFRELTDVDDLQGLLPADPCLEFLWLN